MNDFVKKQKRFKLFRNAFLIFTAFAIFIYIGAEPYIEKNQGNTKAFELLLFILVIVSMALLFIYESKFSKAISFIEDSAYEINDAGYYFIYNSEASKEEFIASVKENLTVNGFKIENNPEVKELLFSFNAFKGCEYLYLVNLESVDKNDILAYSDSAVYDLTANKLRAKGNCAVVFVCDNADESAVSLSKSISRIISGKKVIRIGFAIAELSTGRIYFRGNEPSVLQKLICQYIIGCELPLDKKLIGNEKLEFQIELENKLKDFNIADYKSGKYFER